MASRKKRDWRKLADSLAQVASLLKPDQKRPIADQQKHPNPHPQEDDRQMEKIHSKSNRRYRSSDIHSRPKYRNSRIPKYDHGRKSFLREGPPSSEEQLRLVEHLRQSYPRSLSLLPPQLCQNFIFLSLPKHIVLPVPYILFTTEITVTLLYLRL